MKSLLFAAALMLPAAASAQAPAREPVIVVTAAQVVALKAQARAAYAADAAKSNNTHERIFNAATYHLTLEHRVGRQGASIHAADAELLIVLEGAGAVTTGGTLAGAGAPNAGTTQGKDITGGQTRRVAPGDMILVPEGTAHMLTPDAGQPLIITSFYLPRTGRFAPPAAGAAASRLFQAAADLPAMMARAQAAVAASPRFFGGDTLLSLPPYRVGLEYRSPRGVASVHVNDSELMLVLDGEGVVETGGTLVNPHGTGANIDGDAIQGGTVNRLKTGDFIFVPAGTPHLARTDGRFVLATLHVPAD